MLAVDIDNAASPACEEGEDGQTETYRDRDPQFSTQQWTKVEPESAPVPHRLRTLRLDGSH